MDVNTWITAISSLGFPIAACIAIFYFNIKQSENYRADIKDRDTKHKEEMDKITEALNNNTMVLQRLLDRFEREDRANDN